MIIKFIPETEEEKARSVEFEIHNAKEFMVFGTNITDDGKLSEFHEWTGSYKYLMGSLDYYKEVINDERRDAAARKGSPRSTPPSLRVIERNDD